METLLENDAMIDKNTLQEIDWDNLTFNIYPTRSMFVAKCKKDGEWEKGKIIPYGNVVAFDNLIKSYIHFNNLEDNKLIHYLAENVCSKYAELTTIKFIILRLGYMFGCPIDSKIDRKTLTKLNHKKSLTNPSNSAIL